MKSNAHFYYDVLIDELQKLTYKIEPNSDTLDILRRISISSYIRDINNKDAVKKFVDELKKKSSGESFDLLFMLSFIAKLKDLEHMGKLANKNDLKCYKCHETVNRNKIKITTVLEPYLVEIDSLWGTKTKKYPKGYNKRNAIADVWKKNEEKIRNSIEKLKIGKTISLGSFKSRFNRYLDECRKYFNGITSTGRQLKKYNKL